VKPDDAEEYTQALGQIVAGSWRQIALAHRLGVPSALGYKKADGLRRWVEERLGGYVRMAISERKEAVAELNGEGYSNREIAAVVGVDAKTIRNDKGGENSPVQSENINEIKDDFWDGGENSPLLDAIPGALKTRVENEKGRKAIFNASVDALLESGLYEGDFRDLSEQIKDDSVDLIFTDPPYNSASIDLYADAARVAKRILKPGGSLIAYSGHRHLPDVLSEYRVYLDYWWTIACVHKDGNQILQRLGIRAGWKPLVWFVKGSRSDIQNILIDTVSGGKEKDQHEWQQAEAEAAYYIEKLTPENGLVVDFFAGGGTTCAVAEKLRRRWIAFELDGAAFEKASNRIRKVAA
jgi:SAM-dependent methyltransferase